MEEIEKFELLGFALKPVNEHEFGDMIAELVEVRDGLEIKDFNDRVLDIAERLIWTRQEKELQAKHPALLAQRRAAAKAPRTWCEAECTFHKFHGPDGTPTDYDGNPVPVDRPFPARLNDKEN